MILQSCGCFSRSFVSTREALYVNPNSPATPTVTRIPPVSPQNFLQGNVAAGLRNPPIKSPTGSQYSITKPITTTKVAPSIDHPQQSSEDSSVRETLSSAEGSIRTLQKNKTTFLLILAVGILVTPGAGLNAWLLAPSNDRGERQIYGSVPWHPLPKWKFFKLYARNKFPHLQMQAGFGRIATWRPGSAIKELLQNRIGALISRQPKRL